MTKEELLQYGTKWLELKIHRMKNLLKIAEPDEALYREIMLSLGYPKNKVQFLELALMLPFKEIMNLKEREKIETVLLYRAGFVGAIHELPLPDNFDFSSKMDKSVWNFKGIRPINYPDKRIKGISYLLAETASNGLVHFFLHKIQTVGATFTVAQNNMNNRAGTSPAPTYGNNIAEAGPTPTQIAKECVNKIMNFKGIGIERKREMFFNIILPFFMAYKENEDPEIISFLFNLFELHPPLSENSTIKAFKSRINKSNLSELIYSTKTYFGAIFFMKNAADKKN